MRHDCDGAVAIVGAGGFVGRAVLAELRARAVRATAVVRRATSHNADPFHEVTDPAGIGGRRFGVVVNLAYPTSGPTFEHSRRNEEILSIVDLLAAEGARIVHASTLAVFGFGLEREPVLAAPPRVRDFPYVESKIEMEYRMARLQEQRHLRLEIVRLGNVWGRASPNWVVPLLHRLLTGRPVGVAGCSAPSNATDVANAASYLAFLVQRASRGYVTYHHLAEFAEVPWCDWIEPLAAETGWEPVYASAAAAAQPETLRAELRAALSPIAARAFYRRLASERVAGSWLRSLIQTIPGAPRRKLKGPGLVFASDPEQAREDQALLAVLSAQRTFYSALEPGWQPPVSQEASVTAVLDWFRRG